MKIVSLVYVKMEKELDIKSYIVQEADKLFCQYGFKSVTMDDIAKHLGMSKKTIYQNFKDKNELVTILIEGKLTHQQCTMQHCKVDAANAIEEIFLSIAHIHENLGGLNPKLFYDLQKYHPAAWLHFRSFKENSLAASFMANLERGIAEGLYRAALKKDIITQMRLNHAELVFDKHDHYTMNKYSIAQVMIELTEHFLYGICNEKGLQLFEQYKQHYLPNQHKN